MAALTFSVSDFRSCELSIMAGNLTHLLCLNKQEHIKLLFFGFGIHVDFKNNDKLTYLWLGTLHMLTETRSVC